MPEPRRSSVKASNRFRGAAVSGIRASSYPFADKFYTVRSTGRSSFAISAMMRVLAIW